MNRLEGKVAIITGGNSGVGAATAVKFVNEGAKVVITARREAQLEEVAAKIRELGGEVLPICSDISKPEDAVRVVAETMAKFGKIDILINNAGVLDSGLKAIDSVTDEDMDRVIDINTKGTMCMTREVAKEMAKRWQRQATAQSLTLHPLQALWAAVVLLTLHQRRLLSVLQDIQLFVLRVQTYVATPSAPVQSLHPWLQV